MSHIGSWVGWGTFPSAARREAEALKELTTLDSHRLENLDRILEAMEQLGGVKGLGALPRRLVACDEVHRGMTRYLEEGNCLKTGIPTSFSITRVIDKFTLPVMKQAVFDWSILQDFYRIWSMGLRKRPCRCELATESTAERLY